MDFPGKMERMYAKTLSILLAVLPWIVPLDVRSQPADLKAESLNRRLAGLVQGWQATNGQASCGMAIRDLRTGRWVFRHDARRPLIPASNMKLVTTSAALACLGKDFEFETLLALAGDDLVLIGGGDPGFGDSKLMAAESRGISELFRFWAQRLQEVCGGQVAGQFIVDASIFDSQLQHPAWPKNQLDRWYAAAVCGLNLNDNCLDVTVTASKNDTYSAEVRIEPPNSLIEILGGPSSLKLNPKADKSLVAATWVGDWQVQIRGKLGKRPAGPIYLPVRDPVAFAAYVVREHLQWAGIRIGGPSVKQQLRRPDGSLPSTLQVLARHATPIQRVLVRANRDSQNLFAECLLKRLGFEYLRQHAKLPAQGSWESGRQAVQEFLVNAIGPVLAGQVQVDDGSGLSRKNRVSAEALVMLLDYMVNRDDGETLLSSLAVAGRSGTLRRRLRKTAAEGRIVAKTGYISGVSALSGYVLDGKGQARFAFAMLFNDFARGKLWQARKIQEKVCLELVRSLKRRERTLTTHAAASGQ